MRNSCLCFANVLRSTRWSLTSSSIVVMDCMLFDERASFDDGLTGGFDESLTSILKHVWFNLKDAFEESQKNLQFFAKLLFQVTYGNMSVMSLFNTIKRYFFPWAISIIFWNLKNYNQSSKNLKTKVKMLTFMFLNDNDNLLLTPFKPQQFFSLPSPK